MTSLTSCRLVSKVLDQPYLVQACEQGTGPASLHLSASSYRWLGAAWTSLPTETWCYNVSLSCNPSYCKVNSPFNLILLDWSVLYSPKIKRFLKENVDIKVLSLRIRAKFHNIIYILSFVYMYYEGILIPQSLYSITAWDVDCGVLAIDSIMRLTDVHLTSSCLSLFFYPSLLFRELAIGSSIRLTGFHLTSSCHYPFNLPQSGLRCARHRYQYFGDKSPSPHPRPHSEITMIPCH